MASRTALQFFDDALNIADAVLQANRDSLITTTKSTGVPEAVVAFFAKGQKSMRALRVLALAGYGEDAFIVLRSLTNTAIDMAFISQDETEARLEQWIAVGRLARYALAQAPG